MADQRVHGPTLPHRFQRLAIGIAPLQLPGLQKMNAKSTGVDLEVQWETPIEGLSVAAIGNWNDSEFGKILPQVSATLPAISEGERLTNTTEYNYRFDVDYSRPVGNALTLVSHASASTTSSRIMPDGYEVDSIRCNDATEWPSYESC
jgi:hypothetical protein